ncbi:MAG: amidohydrolase family protein [Coriobacteriales bacterium]|jgi:5-methylthioadenosine/S-adenosylhomocysteine deaminase
MLYTAKYVLPVTSQFIEDGAVLVQDDRISDVGPAAFLKAKYPNEEVRDFGLAALMPGFIDCHTHLGYTALRGMVDDKPYAEWKREVLQVEPFFSDEDWVTSARIGALEAVASGITTIADITSTGCSAVAADEIGLRGRIYAEVMTTKGDRAQAVVDEGADEIESWKSKVGSDLLDFGIAPGPLYACHPKVLATIADYATTNKVPVAMHLAGSHEEEDFIRYGSSPFGVHASESEHRLSGAFPPWLPAGTSPVQYVVNWDILDVPELLAVHCVHVDEQDIKTLADRNVAIAYCPRVNAKLGMGSAPIVKFLAAGLRVGLGTDSPAAVDTTDVIDEMRTGLMIARATSPDPRLHMSGRDALHLATIDAARALGMDDEIGSLEPGKKADIIAIDMHNSHQNPTSNPQSAIIYTCNQDNVMFSMIDGRVLYDNFTHVSGVDRDSIVGAARELRKRVKLQIQDSGLHDELVSRAKEDRRDRYNR